MDSRAAFKMGFHVRSGLGERDQIGSGGFPLAWLCLERKIPLFLLIYPQQAAL